MRYLKIGLALCVLSLMSACKKYLDVVPDNVPTLEYAFRMRSTAEKYLYTCYSYIPPLGDKYNNPGLYGADELWLSDDKTTWRNWNIAKGLQNANSPILGYWSGTNSGTDLFEGINQCNIFLEHIGTVPDMETFEIKQWAAEVKFLKAYYHFLLMRSYGPIPIIDENLPIGASGEEVRVHRRPVDEVVNYIVSIIDEAAIDLPKELLEENIEYGRITLPIALGMKAKILTFAASPLFNGNTDYANFTDKDGTLFFDQTYRVEKWQRAATALKEAIDLAHSAGFKLYNFELTQQTRNINDTTRLKMNIRGTLTDRWNSEIIWANTGSTTGSLQEWCAPKALSKSQTAYSKPNGSTAVTLNLASLFYTDKGVPIDEDKTWDYRNRFELRQIGHDERYNLKEGDTTVAFNFHREPRFYGSLGFDRGTWFGQGRYDHNEQYWLELKRGEFGGKTQAGWHAVTGYYAKKLVHYTNTNPSNSSYSTTDYPWVMLRLGDLYLLYAEALNEINGPSPEVYNYLNQIREKGGLPGVMEAWQNYSRQPNKPNTKDGLREIIQQERAIEMALEGQRFWDLRRWKTAPTVLNQTIQGFDVDQETTEGFYRVRALFDQTFANKDYFWPIREHDLIVNKNLVQNPGW